MGLKETPKFLMSPDPREVGAEAFAAGSGGGPRPGLLRPQAGHGGAPGSRAHCGEESNGPHTQQSLYPPPPLTMFEFGPEPSLFLGNI